MKRRHFREDHKEEFEKLPVLKIVCRTWMGAAINWKPFLGLWILKRFVLIWASLWLSGRCLKRAWGAGAGDALLAENGVWEGRRFSQIVCKILWYQALFGTGHVSSEQRNGLKNFYDMSADSRINGLSFWYAQDKSCLLISPMSGKSLERFFFRMGRFGKIFEFVSKLQSSSLWCGMESVGCSKND